MLRPVAGQAALTQLNSRASLFAVLKINHLREARQTMEQAQDEREAWRERASQYAAAVTDARAVARQSADALEAERAAQARAAARERRRQREIQNVIADSPEPPAWSLRDGGEVSQ